jgi:hypothetical protein
MAHAQREVFIGQIPSLVYELSGKWEMDRDIVPYQDGEGT